MNTSPSDPAKRAGAVPPSPEPETHESTVAEAAAVDSREPKAGSAGPAAHGPARPPTGLDARTPLLLLPVHIQTRFVTPATGGPELWVRIYPDQIAVDSHEPELTDQEVAAGQAYWNVVWQAGNPPSELDLVKAPWRTLASRYGVQRAAWIALALTPTNLSQQPAKATPAGGKPAPVPVFPAVPARKSSWEKPASADALPDAWTVVCVSGGQTSVFRGTPITSPLAISLTPNSGALPAGAVVDADLRWMVEFDLAVQAGMALRISLTQEQRTGGFDQIFVYGTRARDPNASQTLVNLLNAHHYTDGLSIVPQGAPTNNTPDASSAYSSKDPDYDLSFAAERQGALTANPNCDGVACATLLGIPSSTFDHVAYANATGCANGSDMLQALWPATLGYFLSQLMASVFSSAAIEEGHQYALANALPRGPLPALRVGRTPYGVLPVSALRNYGIAPATAGPVEPGLVSFVTKLLPTWLASSASAPRMQRGGDPDQSLMAVLGMDASSMAFQGRQILGNEFLWNLFNFFGLPQSSQAQWWQDLALPLRNLLNSHGYTTWNPRLLNFGFAPNSFPVTLATVQDGPLSETGPLAADANLGGGQLQNYIDWLQTASITNIQAENYPGPKPSSLLYKILRQSILLQSSSLAAQDEVNAGTLTLSQISETEIVSVQPEPTRLTLMQILARASTRDTTVIWADFLGTTNFPVGSPFAALNDFRAGLGRLAQLPTAELDRLLTETLDACSHRLDVWATAIATSLLKRARASQSTALHLGCYGWVEDVRPEAARLPVQGAELASVQALDARRLQKAPAPKLLPVPFQPESDNGGYILAPSPAQAAAAAVLRNGYITHTRTAEEAALSIDLSSERVGKALWLIAGVQQGQSLNALLGYLFEDAMHAQSLDKYIQPFRNKYPVVGAKLTPSSAPSEALAASNVVDGLALRTAWDADQLPAGGSWGPGLPGPGADQNSVIAILKTLDDYADALADLSISEEVFQVIRGNFGGGALMDAISRGSRPPTPDIVDTPRGGIDLTHRLALLLAGTPAPNAAWRGVTQHPRAAAEPWLDSWLGQHLPDPALVRCLVQYDDSGTPRTRTVSLRDLDVGPLDFLSMSGADEVPQRSELENRIRHATAPPATAQNVQIVYQSAALPTGTILFPDALYLALKLRVLIGSSRALGPQDMTTPEDNAESTGGAVNLTDLRTRAGAARQQLKNALAALSSAAAGLPASPGPVRAALLSCGFYGVPGAIPASTTGQDPALAGQASSVIAALKGRYNKVAGLNLTTAQVADLAGLFKTIFGNDFVVLPQFTPPNLAALQAAFGQSSALVASDAQAPARWLLQLTHVRPAASRLDMALSAAQALKGGALYPPALLLAQMPPPPAPPDRWLGLPLDPANLPKKGRVALACVAQGNPASENSLAGLLVDEWNERIPSLQENASVAFHFEEPSARAPQAMLLAVCPDQREFWDDALLQAVLAETLELAKIRTVDLASVQQVGQILPALYFALNLQQATISTQFFISKEPVGVVAKLR
jgi:hypothetical protein